ncbi:unnamed protein product [Thelazia callipaeda]|uniref:Transmembrane protein n=1 Tax=Thelazia callipaeda TaxID=103827 RepID=A0A0N5D8N0_THECL|nr:unnamed protein product [Thelazia callipaeda]
MEGMERKGKEGKGREGNRRKEEGKECVLAAATHLNERHSERLVLRSQNDNCAEEEEASEEREEKKGTFSTERFHPITVLDAAHSITFTCFHPPLAFVVFTKALSRTILVCARDYH